MRGFYQGGRFTPDYESNSISSGINEDLQRFSGTYAEWWVFDPNTTEVDPLYDVGASDGTGRRWVGPHDLPIIRAVINQGSVPTSDRGFYNGDTLHLTINLADIERLYPGVVGNPDLQNRGRIVWLGEVFRPVHVQQSGVVANRFHLAVVECTQILNDELINDPQFKQYAGPFDAPTMPPITAVPPGYGYGPGGPGDEFGYGTGGYGD